VPAPVTSASVTTTDPTLDTLDRAVREHFYAPKLLAERRWAEHVDEARKKLAAKPVDRAAVLGQLVASLRTSHTEYIPPTVPRYAQILSVFEPILKNTTPGCPEPAKTLPPLPFQSEDVDVWWKSIDGHWFVGGVFEGGIGQRARLLLGDEVALADGRPFSPVASFASKAGSPVALSVRRTAGGPLVPITVTPRRASPQETYKEALRASAHVIERGAARVGYVHVWSWAGEEMQDELEDAIDLLNKKGATHFIVDVRDGWGGAGPSFIRIFDRNVPVYDSVMRDGNRYRRDAQIRVPAAMLVNAGSRSGKEGIAHAVKEHHLATLMGERTGGSVLPGSIFCLDDGAVLYLAVGSLTVDGERLEGRGVTPDREVPFDVRYAAGRDPQLEAAIDALASGGNR
jgi:carboxyl-terminal processing protease